MANVLAPFGFREYGSVDGVVPNLGMAVGKMLYSNALYYGDPLIWGTAGYLAAASSTGNTGAGIVGVAYSFSWVSKAQGRTVRQPWYPGSDSVNNADVTVHYTNAPSSLFTAQTTATSAGTAIGGPLVQADIGTFFNFATGSGGSSTTGISSFSIDFSTQAGSSTTLPFYLYAILQAPQLNTAASAGNIGVFGFNPSSFLVS